MSDIMEMVRFRLRVAAAINKITPATLSKRCGYKRYYFSAFLRGSTDSISTDALYKAVEILGVSAAWLYGKEDYDQAPWLQKQDKKKPRRSGAKSREDSES